MEPASTTVDAGSSTTVALRLRNTGDVVEEYRIVPVGDPALWVKVDPPTLKLYPGTSGSVEPTFSPPRTPDATAGPNPYGVQIIPTEHPEATVVPEGNLTVTPFTDIRAELLPPTCRGRFRGRPTLAVDNVGNVKLTASLAGRENGNQLAFDIRPSSLQIEPGRAAFCKVRIKPNRIMWSGQKETRPFKIALQRSGAEPVLVDGSYLQLTLLPRWTFRALSVAMMLVVLFVALWFAVHPTVQSRAVALAVTSGDQPVTAPVGDASLLPTPTAPPSPGQTPNGAAAGGGGTDPAPNTPAANPGGSGGGGGGAGSTSGGSASTQAPMATTVSLPIKPNNAPNLFVEFAQYRLTTIGSDNGCRLSNTPGDLSGVTRGVLDAKTVTSLECFQRVTDKVRGGQLHLAEYGEVGRETMTALWSFDNLGHTTGMISAGHNNWNDYCADAALNWATRTQITPQLLSTWVSQAQAYIRSFAPGGALPTLVAGSSFESAVSTYANAVAYSDQGDVMSRGFGAGLVEQAGVLGSGSVPASLWPPQPIQP